MINSIGVGPSCETSTSESRDLREAIRRRAEEIYELSGRIPGRDLENWVQAEREILQQLNFQPGPRRGVVIQIDGIQYFGEYTLESANGYTAGEFAAGDPVSIRFFGDRMFVIRRNGTELETRVIRKMAVYDR